MIAVPESEQGLSRAIGEAHRRYTRMINLREHGTGYLWQGRFASFPMDEDYLLAAVRYVELNPVRAKMANRPEGWRWSSASAHLSGMDDRLVKVRPMLDRVSDWRGLLASGADRLHEEVRRHERTGRPLGHEGFVCRVSQLLGRDLKIKRAGRKKKEKMILCPSIFPGQDTTDPCGAPLRSTGPAFGWPGAGRGIRRSGRGFHLCATTYRS